ncbi:something about silencing protein 10-like [Homalodisca vitripennis]|uniref:something about silencing protein 10-like n=1 Tax=Homalodisca vitripennis TaxID=197043 RepID=UPI001EEBA8B8|nr:something about silencing protein 10-like [Homalodisca vitripennis]
MGKISKMKSQKADIDLEMEEYEPSESDDDYNDNEKLMLQKAAKRRSKIDDDDEEESEEEVFGIHESDDEDDDGEMEEPVGDEMDSDIEGKDEDNLPDSKAWGSKKKSYYNTDYVDQDYGGFSKAEEEEAALLEEEEARAIQTRLIAELDDTDFSFGTLLPKGSDKQVEDSVLEDDNEVIKTDLSKLSKREKIALLEKESPEFMGLIADFKERMTYARDYLQPILDLVKAGEIPDCPAVKFVCTKFHLTLNYCTNISFYLLLKSKRVRVVNHPVIKRLVQFRKLLEEMDPIDQQIINPQVKEILEIKQKGDKLIIIEPEIPKLPVLTGNRAERRKKLQELLKNEEDTSRIKTSEGVSFEDIQMQDNLDESGSEEPEAESETEKRGITFEIAKNKGLTPKRKKENRNPRVKNKNKFRKATVRRKGQVRGVYKEISRYGGEPFGIKASVSKSIKLK